MASSYKFLTDTDLSPKAIWAWAKKLVQDLNSRDAVLASAALGVPYGALSFWHDSDAPEGWTLCDGASYATADHPSLFLAIGYKYGGGGAWFNVPDFRDRILIGAGSSVALNAKAGAAQMGLTIHNLPTHTHDVTDPGHTHHFTGDVHTHVVNDPQHTHAISDPGHVHNVNDPGHSHEYLRPNFNPVAAGGAGGVADGENTNNTSSSNTGISLDSSGTHITNYAASTGVTIDPTIITGHNDYADTGVTIATAGEGTPFSILPPVFGISVIIKG